MKETGLEAESLSRLFAEIYYRCHPAYTVGLSHQAVRALHLVAVAASEGRPATVGDVASHTGLAPNTASELLKRLEGKGLLRKRRGGVDERVVEVVLTGAGEEALEEHAGLDVGRLAEVLGGMTAEERERVHRGFSLLAERLQARTEIKGG